MGTVINAAAVIIGGTIGMLVKGGLPLRVRDLLMRSLGLCTLFIGISGAISAMMQVDGTRLQANGTLLLICSLGIGAVAGELLRLEDRMEGLAHRLQSMVKSRDDKFVEGFVSNALVICVGAMAVVGALQDGLTHADYKGDSRWYHIHGFCFCPWNWRSFCGRSAFSVSGSHHHSSRNPFSVVQ